MILSGKEIESRINDEIIIDPFDKNRINPNSYNLSLHNELIMYKNSLLDMKKDNEVEKLIIPSKLKSVFLEFPSLNFMLFFIIS